MKALFVKYKQILLYLFFGGCTTLVNIAAYMFCVRVWDLGTVISTTAAWAVSVLTAYVTNRLWVFESRNRGFLGIWKELAGFVGCRLFSGVLDVFLMWLFVDKVGCPELVMKVISNVIVIIINYAASKFWIFKSE